MKKEFSESLPPNFYIEPTGELDKISKREKEAINRDLFLFLEKNKSKFGEAHLHLHIKQHKEKFREIPMMYCILKLSTDRGMFHSSDHGWGAGQSISNALGHLEFQIDKKFGKMMHKAMLRSRTMGQITE